MKVRPPATTAGLTAVAVAIMAVAGTGTAAAQPVTVQFKAACQPDNSLSSSPEIRPSSTTIDAPESVSAGEEFSVTIKTEPIAVPRSVSIATVLNVSRMKIDMAVPDNAEVVSAQALNDGIGLSGAAPSVTRVSEAGAPDANGPVLRLSGNNETIGNSPSSSRNSVGGIVIASTGKGLDGNPTTDNTTVAQLPTIKVVLRAENEGAVDLKLRTAGAAGQWNNPANFLTFLPQATAAFVGTQWAPTSCIPSDSTGAGAALNNGGRTLASVRVGAGAPSEAVATQTSVEGPGEAQANTPVSFAAKVDPKPGNATRVQFKVDGKAYGDPIRVVNGVARLDMTFKTNGTKKVTADFLGDADFKRSTSTPHEVTISGATGPSTTTPTTPAPSGGSSNIFGS